MSLIKTIQRTFRKKGELDPEIYYSEFLKQEDTENLRPFVHRFGGYLPVRSAILAVGSSTFPKSRWKDRKKWNQRDPNLKAAETYQDIDLVIVPEEIIGLAELESSVQNTLSQMDFQFKPYEITTMGVSYNYGNSHEKCGEWKEIILPYLHIDYGLHSIKTHLGNGTRLDLILGRDDLLEKTAEQKIAEERKEKYAFSLLYRK